MKEEIIFQTYAGSKLYGTDNENSDTDIKGVFLPDINDLILGKAPKHYQMTTGNNGTKNNKDDIDECYYSLHYYLELLAKGDTNALDMLFAYGNKSAVLIIDPIFQEIIDNKDKLITKNLKAYLGYCKNQAFKYSLKGDKLNNFKHLQYFIEGLIHKNIKNKDGEWIDLFTALMSFKGYETGIYADYTKNGKVIGKRAKINIFGEHTYIVIMNNNESFLMISDVLFNLNESIVVTLHKLKNTIASYGKRAENATNDNGADYKALSHCVRVLFQTEELLTEGKITFPLKEADFIKFIKFHTTNMTYEDIMDFIEKKMKYIEETLLPKSTLREKADYEWIDEFILKIYQK